MSRIAVLIMPKIDVRAENTHKKDVKTTSKYRLIKNFIKIDNKLNNHHMKHLSTETKLR